MRRLCAAIVLGASLPAGALTWEPETEARVDADYALGPRRVSLLRPALTTGIRGRTGGDDLAPDRFALRGRLRHVRSRFEASGELEGHTEADLIELTADWRGDAATLRLGLQEVVWGETIGVPVADLVNPRDQREPLYADPADARQPAGIALVDLQPASAVTLQLVATPLPPPPRLPERKNGVRVVSGEASEGGEDAEYGARLGWLSGFGLDVKLYGLHHESRAAVFTPRVTGTTPELVSYHGLVDSTGAGFSYGAGPFVLRGDAMRHTAQPFFDPAAQRVRRGTVTRAAAGADWTGAQELLVALQVSHDRYDERFAEALARRELSWAAAKLSLPLLGRMLKAEALAMHGLGHRDSWLQPRLVLQTSGGLTAELRADLLDGEAKGSDYFGPYRDDDRVRMTLRYRF